MKMRISEISFKNIIIKSGLWHTLQKRNAEKTIYAVKDRFTDTGRFDAFEFKWTENMKNKPHFFWDSDVAKWIEGVSYSMINGENRELEPFIDKLVSLIGKNRQSDGYFNIYYTVCEKGMKWTNRRNHELYCAGHLIEAAIAYKRATGKDEFLRYMTEYADCIYKVFVEDKSASFTTPGHQEIELALVRLFEETKNAKYLHLAEFFIDNRGDKDNTKDFKNNETYEQRAYDQSHLPVREQTDAVGHSVRACYMYCAMADLARINNDKKLFLACQRLFDSMVNKRMYITGGIGSSYIKECFTADYDLPNAEAYNETCAAISLAMFANRMLKCEINSKYSDIIEKVIYNGIISGVSVQGTSFFYENPLLIEPKLTDRENKFMEEYKRRRPIRQRVEIFECSCCPPNINRFFASIGDYLYSVDDNTLYIHQYMDSTADIDGDMLTVKTDYPLNGKIKILYNGSRKIAIRRPEWCENVICDLPYGIKNGYMYFETNGDIEIEFEMKPCLMSAASDVCADNGCAAVMRGPVVYCIEAADNGDNLGDIYISPNTVITEQKDELSQLYALYADGERKEKQTKLYSKFNNKSTPCKIRLIPYYTFANRGDSEMRVWINAGKIKNKEGENANEQKTI